MVVEWADLVVLDGKREGYPGSSEGTAGAIDAGALVEVEAEHDGGVAEEEYLGEG